MAEKIVSKAEMSKIVAALEQRVVLLKLAAHEAEKKYTVISACDRDNLNALHLAAVQLKDAKSGLRKASRELVLLREALKGAA